jgi:hypothetical protein
MLSVMKNLSQERRCSGQRKAGVQHGQIRARSSGTGIAEAAGPGGGYSAQVSGRPQIRSRQYEYSVCSLRSRK